MFPMPMPELPPEFMDLAANNPEGFAEAMGDGMEAMTAAIGDGATVADAFEAMGDAMGPLMEDMGITPEIFDAAGDAVGAAIGPAMHMAPADASPADMGAMMQDGLDMMTPEGTEVPAPIMDAMGDMGTAMGDAGMSCHDCGAEMMGDPGSDTYMLPTDGQGDPIVEAGQPETCPADACQSPPADGACAATDMMPPEGGYDHAPMNDDIVMPEPYVMATPDPTGELSGAENIAPADNADTPAADDVYPAPASDDGGIGALGDALGNDNPAADTPVSTDGDAMDAAVGSALDGAMEQGGGAPTAPVADDAVDAPVTTDGDAAHDEVDPSAGMG
jgi:hypothetical protein